MQFYKVKKKKSVSYLSPISQTLLGQIQSMMKDHVAQFHKALVSKHCRKRTALVLQIRWHFLVCKSLQVIKTKGEFTVLDSFENFGSNVRIIKISCNVNLQATLHLENYISSTITALNIKIRL